MTNYDIAIIGSGPGGYVAAIRASQLGKKVCIIERDNLGGICLNWGCIPTKALLRSSEIYHQAQHLEKFGLNPVKDAGFDIKKVVERSRGVSSQLSGGIGHLMKKNKIEVINGTATLQGAKKIQVVAKDKKFEVTADHIIIATGARARSLPGFEADGKLIWSYKEAMVPETMPKSLIVVGSGAIGVEFACFYKNMGAEVTLLEAQDRIMPVEDEEISKFARKQFEKHGMKILTSVKLQKAEKGKDNVTVTFEHAGKTEKVTADRLIMAVGIVPNSENIGLEKTKVKTDRGHIITNGFMQTDEPGIYAIGDVAGAPWLAHKASHEGIICVENIAGKKVKPMIKENIPGCTYGHPQVASIGLTEQQAKDKGYKLKVGRFALIGNGKAIALGEPDGIIKTIFDEKTGELLGAHMAGPEVTELIQGFAIAKTMEATEEDIMHTIFPHPTISEAIHESVLSAYDRVIHM